ncbi:MAG: hypothetical protein ACPGJV_06370 [Bacteriovoracaceae bacterium]
MGILQTFILSLVFGLSFSSSYAATVSELQELNLAKAELALVDGDDREALRLISQNLSRKHFHLASYQFLADFYFDNEIFAKGYRVLYYMIRKLHTPHLLKAPEGKVLNKVLRKVPKASEEALGIYFDIATKYYNHSGLPYFNDKKRPYFLLKLSRKYFSILDHYQFKTAEVKYYQGLIAKKMAKYNKAITKFFEAKDIFEEKYKDKETSEQIDFLIGETLLTSGSTDSGSIFLQSIAIRGKRRSLQNGQSQDATLASYAESYLDSLYSDNYSVFSVTYGMSENSNVHSLSDANRDDFSSISSFYDSESGRSEDMTASYYFNSKQFGHYQYIASAYYSQSQYDNAKINFQDSKSYGASFDIRYDNLLKSLAKFGYSYAKSLYRPEAGGSFTDLSASNTIYLQYGQVFKSGILKTKIPYTFNDNVISENSYSFGIELSFVPYLKTKNWRPSYQIDINRNSETSGPPMTTEYQLSFTNHFKITNYDSVFLTLDYTLYNNSDPDTGYNQYQANLSYSRSFKFWRGLSFSASYNLRKRNKDNDETVNENIMSAGLTASF